MAPPLHFNAQELNDLANGHDGVATDVLAAFKPDAVLSGSVGAYGAVGAIFQVAVVKYMSWLEASSRQLAGSYTAQGVRIRNAAVTLSATDQENAQGFTPHR